LTGHVVVALNVDGTCDRPAATSTPVSAGTILAFKTFIVV
jgi:hypothetical protein